MGVKASGTFPAWNGLMLALTILWVLSPLAPRPDATGRSRLRFTTRRKFTTRAQPAPVESNAVPDRSSSLTDYERGPFRALPEGVPPALFGRAQSLITPA